jgi:hypothetical protein
MSSGIFRPPYFLPPRNPLSNAGVGLLSKVAAPGGTSPPFMLIGQNGTYTSRIM